LVYHLSASVETPTGFWCFDESSVYFNQRDYITSQTQEEKIMRSALQFNKRVPILIAVALVFALVGCSNERDEVIAPDSELQSTLAVAEDADFAEENLSNLNIAAAPGASNWHNLSDSQRNQFILDEARKWITNPLSWGGQCKWWLQNKVVNVASGGAVYLPQNFSSPGHTYHLAKWKNSSDVQVVWQGAYYCPARFASNLKPGHIIQMRFQDGGLHTALIESVNAYNMMWIDANWSPNNDELVRRHYFGLGDWSRKVEAWTVYQIK
jgi:hypothetical protein